MKEKIPQLIVLIHENAKAKGFWPEETNLFFKDRCLLLITSEVIEAMEALRIDKYSLNEKFNNCMGEQSFTWCFEEYVKNSFEDEIADTVIRLFDYCGGFGLRVESVITHFNKTYEGLYETEIQDVNSWLFTIVRTITDIKYQPFGNQYVGEALAKLCYLMDKQNFDLLKHIELKIKYNATRPHKHGKNF